MATRLNCAYNFANGEDEENKNVWSSMLGFNLQIDKSRYFKTSPQCRTKYVNGEEKIR